MCRIHRVFDNEEIMQSGKSVAIAVLFAAVAVSARAQGPDELWTRP
jgi:hypothetical protein